jgi:hypothetical protein
MPTRKYSLAVIILLYWDELFDASPSGIVRD